MGKIQVIVLTFLMLIVILLLLFCVSFLFAYVKAIQHTPHLKSYENIIFILVVIAVIGLLLKCLFFLYERVQLFMQIIHITNSPHLESYNNETYRSSLGRRVIAIDTESVGAGPRGNIAMLARVSLVSRNGRVLDRYVRPRWPVTDYRTRYSGIREGDLVNAEDYNKIRELVAYNIQDCILVGHDIKNDLKILNLRHPAEDIRDTSTHKPLRDMLKKKFLDEQYVNCYSYIIHFNDDEMSWFRCFIYKKAEEIISQKPSLKLLAKKLLKRDIQVDEHSSIEDARAVMDLYKLVEIDWEIGIAYLR